MSKTIDNRSVKLAIVDDHNLFRKGLIKLINLADTHNKYVILFEAENGTDLTRKLDNTNLPDIILMDIEMPGMNGYESVFWLNRNYPSIRILVISMIETEEAILRMLALGVNGLLSKDIEVEDMHLALETITNKGFYYSENAVQFIKGSAQKDKASLGYAFKDAGLSQVEREFLALACTDLTYYQIAQKMFLSPKTIDGYREALFRKLGVTTRVTLAIYAIKNGLVKL